MRSSNLLLGLMALACLTVMTCAIAAGQEGSTYVDPAVEEVKEQILSEKKTDTNSYKGALGQLHRLMIPIRKPHP